MDIRVDYAQLQQIRGRFETRRETLHQMVTGLENHIGDLRAGGWTGRGAQAFYREMDNVVLPQLRRLVAAYEQAGGCCQTIHDNFQQGEQEATQHVQFQADDVTATGEIKYVSADPTLIMQDFGGEPDVTDSEEAWDDAWDEFRSAEPGTLMTLPNGIQIRIPENHVFTQNREAYFRLLSQPWLRDHAARALLDGNEMYEIMENTDSDWLNLDYYGASIAFPDEEAAQDMIENIFRDPGAYGGGADFRLEDRRGDPNQTGPGDLFRIMMGDHGDIVVVERGQLQNDTGQITGEYIVVQTITGDLYSTAEHTHPVNGARMFGYEQVGQTEAGEPIYSIYTRGADEADMGGFFARSQQEKQWFDWQAGLIETAEERGYNSMSYSHWRNYSEEGITTSPNRTDQSYMPDDTINPILTPVDGS